VRLHHFQESTGPKLRTNDTEAYLREAHGAQGQLVERRLAVVELEGYKWFFEDDDRTTLLVATLAVQSAAEATRSSSTMAADGRQELPTPAEVRKKYFETVGTNRASCCQCSCAERSCGDRSEQHDGCR
jgi:hypothetical protein